MIVSKRLMLAALQALEADLATRTEPDRIGLAAIYAGECRNVRLALNCYSDDVLLTSPRITLPGEK